MNNSISKQHIQDPLMSMGEDHAVYLHGKRPIEVEGETKILDEGARHQPDRPELYKRCLLGDGTSTIDLSEGISGILTLKGWTKVSGEWDYGDITIGLSGTTLTIQSSTHYKSIERYDDGVLVDTFVFEEGNGLTIYSNTGAEATITTADINAVRTTQDDAPLLPLSGDVVGWGYQNAIDIQQRILYSPYFTSNVSDLENNPVLPFQNNIGAFYYAGGGEVRVYSTTINESDFRTWFAISCVTGDTNTEFIPTGAEASGYYQDSEGVYIRLNNNADHNSVGYIRISNLNINNGIYRNFKILSNSSVFITVRSNSHLAIEQYLIDKRGDVVYDADGILSGNPYYRSLKGLYEYYNGANTPQDAKDFLDAEIESITGLADVNTWYASIPTPPHYFVSLWELNLQYRVEYTNYNSLTEFSASDFRHNLSGTYNSIMDGRSLPKVTDIIVSTNQFTEQTAKVYFGDILSDIQIPKLSNADTDINGEALIYTGRKDQPITVGGIGLQMDTLRDVEINCSQSLTGVTVDAVYGENANTGEKLVVGDIGIDTVNDQLYNNNANGDDIIVARIDLSDGTQLVYLAGEDNEGNVVYSDQMRDASQVGGNDATVTGSDLQAATVYQKYYNHGIVYGTTRNRIDFNPANYDVADAVFVGTLSQAYRYSIDLINFPVSRDNDGSITIDSTLGIQGGLYPTFWLVLSSPDGVGSQRTWRVDSIFKANRFKIELESNVDVEFRVSDYLYIILQDYINSKIDTYGDLVVGDTSYSTFDSIKAWYDNNVSYQAGFDALFTPYGVSSFGDFYQWYIDNGINTVGLTTIRIGNISSGILHNGARTVYEESSFIANDIGANTSSLWARGRRYWVDNAVSLVNVDNNYLEVVEIDGYCKIYDGFIGDEERLPCLTDGSNTDCRFGEDAERPSGTYISQKALTKTHNAPFKALDYAQQSNEDFKNEITDPFGNIRYNRLISPISLNYGDRDFPCLRLEGSSYVRVNQVDGSTRIQALITSYTSSVSAVRTIIGHETSDNYFFGYRDSDEILTRNGSNTEVITTTFDLTSEPHIVEIFNNGASIIITLYDLLGNVIEEHTLSNNNAAWMRIDGLFATDLTDLSEARYFTGELGWIKAYDGINGDNLTNYWIYTGDNSKIIQDRVSGNHGVLTTNDVALNQGVQNVFNPFVYGYNRPSDGYLRTANTDVLGSYSGVTTSEAYTTGITNNYAIYLRENKPIEADGKTKILDEGAEYQPDRPELYKRCLYMDGSGDGRIESLNWATPILTEIHGFADIWVKPDTFGSEHRVVDASTTGEMFRWLRLEVNGTIGSAAAKQDYAVISDGQTGGVTTFSSKTWDWDNGDWYKISVGKERNDSDNGTNLYIKVNDEIAIQWYVSDVDKATEGFTFTWDLDEIGHRSGGGGYFKGWFHSITFPTGLSMMFEEGTDTSVYASDGTTGTITTADIDALRVEQEDAPLLENSGDVVGFSEYLYFDGVSDYWEFETPIPILRNDGDYVEWNVAGWFNDSSSNKTILFSENPNGAGSSEGHPHLYLRYDSVQVRLYTNASGRFQSNPFIANNLDEIVSIRVTRIDNSNVTLKVVLVDDTVIEEALSNTFLNGYDLDSYPLSIERMFERKGSYTKAILRNLDVNGTVYTFSNIPSKLQNSNYKQIQLPKDSNQNTSIYSDTLTHTGRKDQPLTVGGIGLQMDTLRDVEINCSQSLTGVSVTAVYGENANTGEKLVVADIGIDTGTDQLYNNNSSGHDIIVARIDLSDGTQLVYLGGEDNEGNVVHSTNMRAANAVGGNDATITGSNLVVDGVQYQRYYNHGVLYGESFANSVNIDTIITETNSNNIITASDADSFNDYSTYKRAVWFSSSGTIWLYAKKDANGDFYNIDGTTSNTPNPLTPGFYTDPTYGYYYQTYWKGGMNAFYRNLNPRLSAAKYSLLISVGSSFTVRLRSNSLSNQWNSYFATTYANDAEAPNYLVPLSAQYTIASTKDWYDYLKTQGRESEIDNFFAYWNITYDDVYADILAEYGSAPTGIRSTYVMQCDSIIVYPAGDLQTIANSNTIINSYSYYTGDSYRAMVWAEGRELQYTDYIDIGPLSLTYMKVYYEYFKFNDQPLIPCLTDGTNKDVVYNQDAERPSGVHISQKALTQTRNPNFKWNEFAQLSNEDLKRAITDSQSNNVFDRLLTPLSLNHADKGFPAFKNRDDSTNTVGDYFVLDTPISLSGVAELEVMWLGYTPKTYTQTILGASVSDNVHYLSIDNTGIIGGANGWSSTAPTLPSNFIFRYVINYNTNLREVYVYDLARNLLFSETDIASTNGYVGVVTIFTTLQIGNPKRNPSGTFPYVSIKIDGVITNKWIYTGNNSYLIQDVVGGNHGWLTTSDITTNQGVQNVFNPEHYGYNDYEILDTDLNQQSPTYTPRVSDEQNTNITNLYARYLTVSGATEENGVTIIPDDAVSRQPDRPELYKRCLYFDGSTYISFPNTSDWYLDSSEVGGVLNSYEVEVWIKVTSNQTGANVFWGNISANIVDGIINITANIVDGIINITSNLGLDYTEIANGFDVRDTGWINVRFNFDLANDTYTIYTRYSQNDSWFLYQQRIYNSYSTGNPTGFFFDGFGARNISTSPIQYLTGVYLKSLKLTVDGSELGEMMFEEGDGTTVYATDGTEGTITTADIDAVRAEQEDAPLLPTSGDMVGSLRTLNYNGTNQYTDVNIGSSNIATTIDGDFSCTLWFKQLSTGSATILSTATSSGGKSGFEFKLNGLNRLGYYLKDDAGNFRNRDNVNVITLNQLYHLAMTYDYSTQEWIIYIDGVEVNNQSHTSVTAPTGTNTLIEIAKYASCLISNVKIFNQVLTPTNITEDIAGTLSVEPINHWKLDELEGDSIAIDIGSSPVNGTHYNTPTNGEFLPSLSGVKTFTGRKDFPLTPKDEPSYKGQSTDYATLTIPHTPTDSTYRVEAWLTEYDDTIARRQTFIGSDSSDQVIVGLLYNQFSWLHGNGNAKDVDTGIDIPDAITQYGAVKYVCEYTLDSVGSGTAIEWWLYSPNGKILANKTATETNSTNVSLYSYDYLFVSKDGATLKRQFEGATPVVWLFKDDVLIHHWEYLGNNSLVIWDRKNGNHATITTVDITANQATQDIYSSRLKDGWSRFVYFNGTNYWQFTEIDLLPNDGAYFELGLNGLESGKNYLLGEDSGSYQGLEIDNASVYIRLIYSGAAFFNSNLISKMPVETISKFRVTRVDNLNIQFTVTDVEGTVVEETVGNNGSGHTLDSHPFGMTRLFNDTVNTSSGILRYFDVNGTVYDLDNPLDDSEYIDIPASIDNPTQNIFGNTLTHPSGTYLHEDLKLSLPNFKTLDTALQSNEDLKQSITDSQGNNVFDRLLTPLSLNHADKGFPALKFNGSDTDLVEITTIIYPNNGVTVLEALITRYADTGICAVFGNKVNNDNYCIGFNNNNWYFRQGTNSDIINAWTGLDLSALGSFVYRISISCEDSDFTLANSILFEILDLSGTILASREETDVALNSSRQISTLGAGSDTSVPDVYYECDADFAWFKYYENNTLTNYWTYTGNNSFLIQDKVGGNHGTLNTADVAANQGTQDVYNPFVDGKNVLRNNIPISDSIFNLGDSQYGEIHGLTVTTNQTDVDGGTTAIILTEDNTDGNPRSTWFENDNTSELVNTVIGETYTWSVWLKTTATFDGSQIRIGINGGHSASAGSELITLTTNWQRFSVTKTATVSDPRNALIGGWGSITQGSGLKIYACKPQFEKGELTDYQPTLHTDTIPSIDTHIIAPKEPYNGTDVFGNDLTTLSTLNTAIASGDTVGQLTKYNDTWVDLMYQSVTATSGGTFVGNGLSTEAIITNVNALPAEYAESNRGYEFKVVADIQTSISQDIWLELQLGGTPLRTLYNDSFAIEEANEIYNSTDTRFKLTSGFTTGQTIEFYTKESSIDISNRNITYYFGSVNKTALTANDTVNITNVEIYVYTDYLGGVVLKDQSTSNSDILGKTVQNQPYIESQIIDGTLPTLLQSGTTGSWLDMYTPSGVTISQTSNPSILFTGNSVVNEVLLKGFTVFNEDILNYNNGQYEFDMFVDVSVGDQTKDLWLQLYLGGQPLTCVGDTGSTITVVPKTTGSTTDTRFKITTAEFSGSGKTLVFNVTGPTQFESSANTIYVYAQTTDSRLLLSSGDSITLDNIQIKLKSNTAGIPRVIFARPYNYETDEFGNQLSNPETRLRRKKMLLTKTNDK